MTQPDSLAKIVAELRANAKMYSYGAEWSAFADRIERLDAKMRNELNAVKYERDVWKAKVVAWEHCESDLRARLAECEAKRSLENK